MHAIIGFGSIWKRLSHNEITPEDITVVGMIIMSRSLSFCQVTIIMYLKKKIEKVKSNNKERFSGGYV